MTGFTQILDRAQACGPLKAWSVIVTVMGDFLPAPEDRISGRVLAQLLEPLGISNQTVRVAIHRLKRDGWVSSAKDGRQSSYGLTASGFQMSRAAEGLIYGVGLAEPDIWVALAPPTLTAQEFADLAPDGASLLAPRYAISAEGRLDWPEGCLLSQFDPLDTPIPDWLRDQLADEALCDTYTALVRLAEDAAALKGSALERAVLRALVVHHWRRLRLRHGRLAHVVLGPDWPGARAERAVTAALDTLPRPDPALLASQTETL